MELNLIFDGSVTLEDMCELNEKKGLQFVIEDGQITEVIF